MQRLCERPGCSEPASVAYGMRAEDLVFWLDVMRTDDPESALDAAGGGVLCRRHADSMVVPRDWTLDDLRQPDLHLFRPPEAEVPADRRTRRRSAGGDGPVEQLALVVDPAPPAGAEPPVTDVAETVMSTDSDTDSETDSQSASQPEPVEPWTPSFDAGDDLDGLLSANSPLLARAFRGTDRSKDS